MQPLHTALEITSPRERLLERTSSGSGSTGARFGPSGSSRSETDDEKAHGFRTGKAIELALYHGLGAIPEPKSTHEFC